MSIILTIALITTVIVSVASVDNKKYHNNFETDNKNEISIKNTLFLDQYVVMEEMPVFDDRYESSRPMIVDTPSYFSWTSVDNLDWTTPAKHQGPCGSCWAFAGVGIIESIIKIREQRSDINPDLSEQYILSCLSDAGSCHGGNTFRAFQLINDTSEDGNNVNGIILESCLEYGADDEIPCSDKCEDWMDYLVPISNYGYWRPDGSKQDRDAIKSQIYVNGPVVAHIRATDIFKYWGALIHNPNTYFFSIRPSFFTNHVIVVVGWKDDSRVLNGGYWICKNSWGTEWGYDGFFNIAYGSLGIDKFPIIWVDYDPDSYDWP